MAQQQNSNFVLSQSGMPFALVNAVNNSANALTVSYVPTGITGNCAVVVEGISFAQGGCVAVLDSLSFSANVTARSINVSSFFDQYRFTPTFSGTAQAGIGVSVTVSGSGFVYSAVSGPVIHTQ